MIRQTSTVDAPWTIVEADDKPWARVKVLETVVKGVEGKV
jgi:polyphosphate kinase 2 (PPK2 family)